jgi:D-sedoheptulose 7-phosphate isomerase
LETGMVVALTAEHSAEAFARRSEPTAALATEANGIARACHAMARRFHRGGRLLAFGEGACGADAAHVVVEFVHPVIVGKRALPAMNLSAGAGGQGMDDRLRLHGAPEDIALGISSDGNCATVAAALAAASEAGLLTVALLGGDGGQIAALPGLDHALLARSGDPLVTREMHVTTYHVLWELVHVFLDHAEVLD